MRRAACGCTAEGCCAGQRCCMAAGWGVVRTLCVCTGGMSEFWSSCPWLQGLHHMCYRAECCAFHGDAVRFQEMPRLFRSACSCIFAHITLRKAAVLAVFGTGLLGIYLAFPSSIPLSPTFRHQPSPFPPLTTAPTAAC